MAVATSERCRRCATKIRTPRKVCPCCGWDPHEKTSASPDASDVDKPSSHPIRKVAAKAGVKICPICLSSVPEEQLVDQDNQKLCSTCAESLRNKSARKGAPPPEKK